MKKVLTLAAAVLTVTFAACGGEFVDEDEHSIDEQGRTTNFYGSTVERRCITNEDCRKSGALFCEPGCQKRTCRNFGSPVIIDNGDKRTWMYKTWSASSVPGPWGPKSVVARTKGARYIWPTGRLPDYLGHLTYRVSMWWTAHKNRDPAAKVRIYNGYYKGTVSRVFTGTVDQRTRGSRWVMLNGGEALNFTRGFGTVVLERSGGGTATVADAVRFQGYRCGSWYKDDGHKDGGGGR